MKLVTAAQMRELDRRTMEEFGVSGEELMDRAGHGVADVVRRLMDASGFYNAFVLLIAGRGNNGGDAFVAARHLKDMGVEVEVWLAGVAEEVQGDARTHLETMRQAEIPLEELPTKEDWEFSMDTPSGASVIVDGVLGTGLQGPARGPAVGAIQYINAHARESLVVSIDIPSGLNADTGTAAGSAVMADVTVTMGLPKRGLVESAALDFVGNIEVIDIGITPELVNSVEPDTSIEFIDVQDLRPILVRRARASHKGMYGHALLIGGARGTAGAIALASLAAARSGAGLVTTWTPESVASIVAGTSIETMTHGLPETAEGSLAWPLSDEALASLSGFDAVLAGPGLTRGPQSRALVEALLDRCTGPLVLDADALAVFAGDAAWLARARCPVAITPHPGELAMLLGCSVSEIQSDRLGAARRAAEITRSTVVLKGAGTLVCAAGGGAYVNMTGNPGMATGGAGDVLAGLLAGLLAQGHSAVNAARLAVFLHGRAGDLAAWHTSQAGLTAGDLVDELPYAFRDVCLR